MHTGSDHIQPTEAQRDDAARWLMRQDGGAMSAAERTEMLSWLQADPRHALALHEAQALWGGLAAPARTLAAHKAEHLASLLTAARRPPLLRAPRWLSGNWTRGAWAMAACAALLLMWSLLPDLGRATQNLTADSWTPHGETRKVALPDGSTATLAGNSAIRISFDKQQRHVQLLRGEAFFDVRPGMPQPFIVEAGKSWARVVGTAFNVHLHGDVAQVAVEHGLVDVGGLPDSGSLRLAAGYAADVVAGRPGAARIVDLAEVTAWRSGRMVFYREDLAAVISRLQEQRPGRILVSDAALAHRKVSGAFPAEDVDGTVTAIADTLGVKVTRVTPWLTVIH